MYTCTMSIEQSLEEKNELEKKCQTNIIIIAVNGARGHNGRFE